jgi:hypothetical protein
MNQFRAAERRAASARGPGPRAAQIDIWSPSKSAPKYLQTVTLSFRVWTRGSRTTTAERADVLDRSRVGARLM